MEGYLIFLAGILAFNIAARAIAHSYIRYTDRLIARYIAASVVKRDLFKHRKQRLEKIYRES